MPFADKYHIKNNKFWIGLLAPEWGFAVPFTDLRDITIYDLEDLRYPVLEILYEVLADYGSFG